MKKQIILSGKVASGKTTVGKLLATRLNFHFDSMGNYIRGIAREQKMDIQEYQKLCTSNPNLDQKHDRDFFNRFKNSSHIVLDYRLGFHFFTDAYCVLLDVSDNEAISRLKANPRSDEHHSQTIKRNQLFKEQFQNAYDIEDYLSSNHYDLVVNVDNLTSEEVVNRIIEAYEDYSID